MKSARDMTSSLTRSSRAGRWMVRSVRAGRWIAACAVGISSTAACSVLLDWGGYTGGLDAGPADSGNYLVTCGTNQYCAPTVPPGWTGPVAFGELAIEAGVPTCGSDYESRFQGSAGLNAPPARCSCSCSAPSGQTCPMPEVTFFSEQTCATMCGTPAMLNTSTCVSGGSSCNYFEVGSSVAQGGSCSVAEAGVVLPGAGWARQSLECAPTNTPGQGTCSSGEFCLPAPPASLEFCIRQSGQAVSCPPDSGYDQGPFVEYSGATTDDRHCGPCTCDAPAGSTCDQATGFTYGSNCGIPTVPFAAPTTCLLSAGGQRANLIPLNARGGTCTAGGGTPMGGVTPTDTPTSFCCAP